jgi:hypothetical protein
MSRGDLASLLRYGFSLGTTLGWSKSLSCTVCVCVTVCVYVSECHTLYVLAVNEAECVSPPMPNALDKPAFLCSSASLSLVNRLMRSVMGELPGEVGTEHVQSFMSRSD